MMGHQRRGERGSVRLAVDSSKIVESPRLSLGMQQLAIHNQIVPLGDEHE